MLRAISLRKRFDGATAVDNVNITLHSGEVLGLVGPNGSGKSTLSELLAGRCKPDSGSVLIDGQAARSGLHLSKVAACAFRSYQLPRIFPEHTVEENIRLGGWRWKAIAQEISEGLPIESLPNLFQKAGTLSVGQQRRLVLSWLYQRLTTVKYFFLDEPSVGGDESYIRELLTFIKEAKSIGCGILIIEHNISLLRSIADRILYMDNGRCYDAQPSESSRATVTMVKRPEINGSGVKLAASDLWVDRDSSTVLRGVSIEVGQGEIVGLIGRNGSGKSTYLLALYGDKRCKITQGSVSDGHYELPRGSVNDRLNRRIFLLPQDGGIFKSLTVEENILVSIECACKRESIADNIHSVIVAIPHIKRIWNQRGGTLSGGERRLAGIARIIALQPRFALLDEPSAGLDHGAKRALAVAINMLASQGVGIIMAEQDKGFAELLCNRIETLNNDPRICVARKEDGCGAQ